MPHIDDLAPYFDADVISPQINHDQIKVLFGLFKADFIDNHVVVGGKTLLINASPPKVSEYKDYAETFYHIITKEIRTYSDRFYECERANRIHWIRPILESPPCNDILYYKWMDSKNRCREHFWLIHKKFMVVITDIGSKKGIVTAFCVDDDRKTDYFEKYDNFRAGKCKCP